MLKVIQLFGAGAAAGVEGLTEGSILLSNIVRNTHAVFTKPDFFSNEYVFTMRGIQKT